MRDRILYVSNRDPASSSENLLEHQKDRLLYIANPEHSGGTDEAEEDKGRPLCGIYGISRAYSYDGGSGDAVKRRARLLQLTNAHPADNAFSDDECADPENSPPSILPYLGDSSPQPISSPSEISPSDVFPVSNSGGPSGSNDEPSSASSRTGRTGLRRRRLAPFATRNTPRRLGTLPPRHTSESYIIPPTNISSNGHQEDVDDDDWVPIAAHRYSHKHSHSSPHLSRYPQSNWFPSPPPETILNTDLAFQTPWPPAEISPSTKKVLQDIYPNIPASNVRESSDEVPASATRLRLKFVQHIKSALFKTPNSRKPQALIPLITSFPPPTIPKGVSIVLNMPGWDHYHIVDVGGSPNGRIVRNRVLAKLKILDNHNTFAICRAGGGTTGLTDQELYILCRDQGDSKGTLSFFVYKDISQVIVNTQSSVLPNNSTFLASPPSNEQGSRSRAGSEPFGSERSRYEMKQPSSAQAAGTDNLEPGFFRPPRQIQHLHVSSSLPDLPSTAQDLQQVPGSIAQANRWRLPDTPSSLFMQDEESKPKSFSGHAEQFVYQNLVSFLVSRISADHINDHELWDEFQGYLDRVATMDRVLCLAESDLCRTRLLQFSTRLGLSGSPAVRKALERDEELLVTLLRDIMDSKPAKESVLLLKNENAYAFLDFLQWVISKGFLDAHGAHKKARRLFVKLSLKADIILPSQLISGLELLNNGEPVNGGGYADIFRAVYQGKEVAVKRIRAHLGKDSQKVRRAFSQEALVWRHLRHSNVLPFLGIDSEMFTSSLCMVSPWMKNGTIMEFRAANGASNVDIEQRLVEIADGLRYLHAEGVIHGDLRGGNILIDDDWHAVLADFGLTTFGDATMSATTNETNARGTTRWMAPELLVPEIDDINGLRKTQASDVYAFGCVCLELYTGRPPFADTKNETAVVCLLVQGRRPSVDTLIREAQVSVPECIRDLVEKCWKQAPHERPGSSEIANVLKRAVN